MNYSNSVVDVVKLNVTIWVEDGGGKKLKSLHSKLNRVYAGPSNKNLTPGKNFELDLSNFLLTMFRCLWYTPWSQQISKHN